MTKTLRNDPSKAGQPAGRKEAVAGNTRYAVWPIHTRFDAVEWLVADAEIVDPVTGAPAIIRQESTREAAVAGVGTNDPDLWAE